MKNLKFLELDRTQITDAGLKELAKLQQLTKLGLVNGKITDAGFREVVKLEKLTYLNLTNTEITDVSVEEIDRVVERPGEKPDEAEIDRAVQVAHAERSFIIVKKVEFLGADKEMVRYLFASARVDLHGVLPAVIDLIAITLSRVRVLEFRVNRLIGIRDQGA